MPNMMFNQLLNPGSKKKRNIEPQMDFSSLLGEYEDYDIEEPETPYRTKYLETLMEQPRQEDFRPSFGRKLLGGLAGGLMGLRDPGAGVRMAEHIVGQPYNKALESFKSKIEPLGQAAKIEGEDVKQHNALLKDRLRQAREKNKYILDVMKAESLHQKRLKEIENIEDDNERSDAKLKADEEYKKELLKRRDAFLTETRLKRQGTERYRQQRLGMIREGREDKPLYTTGKEIREEALREVSQDERFKEFWDPEVKKFTNEVVQQGKIVKIMDEETEEQLKHAITRAEGRAAKKTRQSFIDAAYEQDPLHPFDDDEEEEEDY